MGIWKSLIERNKTYNPTITYSELVIWRMKEEERKRKEEEEEQRLKVASTEEQCKQVIAVFDATGDDFEVQSDQV